MRLDRHGRFGAHPAAALDQAAAVFMYLTFQLIGNVVDAGEDTLQYTGVISPENKGKVDFDKLISEIIYK